MARSKKLSDTATLAMSGLYLYDMRLTVWLRSKWGEKKFRNAILALDGRARTYLVEDSRNRRGSYTWICLFKAEGNNLHPVTLQRKLTAVYERILVAYDEATKK